MNDCPFKVGEIAVFKSYLRFETYITRVMRIHVENYGKGWIPEVRKATIEEKREWYKSGKHELVIESNITE